MPVSYRPLPTERLQELLTYCPETGVLRWSENAHSRAKGRIAGTPDGRGYLLFRLDRRSILAHRAAWFLHYKQDPLQLQIDHINCNRSDNRIENLRLATHTQNQRNEQLRKNNTSGHKGVYWKKSHQKWMAHIYACGEKIYLGHFDSAEKAAEAVRAARETLHGNFANHG